MCKSISLNLRLWIGLLSFLVSLMFVEYIIPFGTFDVGPASSFLTVITGLFLGAIISKAIYDHINRESQKRQWKHDYALQRLREIYGPLWDETTDALTALKDFRVPRDLLSEYMRVDALGDAQIGFKRLIDTHLGLFIDGDARDLLQQFHDSMDKHRAASGLAWSELHTVAEQKAQLVMAKYNSQGSSNELVQAFQNDIRVVYDRSADVRHSRDAYIRAHEFISSSREAASKDYIETLTALRELASVEEVRRAREVAVAKGSDALERLKVIISDPSSVVLEFD